MIDNAALETILDDAEDISVVAEIYAADAVPSSDGFDPTDALDRFAAVSGITVAGQSYKKLVKSFGKINRKISGEANKASVTFSNNTREISQFEFDQGFEGLILVIRLISRAASGAVEDTQILFTGRCEKPTSGNKDSLTVSATWILGGLEIQIPRRKFIQEDGEGRVSTDPNFEGFLFMPQEGTISYSVRLKKGGILGFLGFKRTVKQTLQYSSHSDLDANKCLPVILGRAQIMLVHIAYADVGTELRMRSAVCEGEISDIQNLRAIGTRLALIGDWSFAPGSVGAANNLPGSVEWPGNTSVGKAYYSRTAQVISHASNSAVDEDEPAPDLVAVIFGSLMTIPNGDGDWVLGDEWSDNPTAHTRFLLTSPDYYNLDDNWIDDEAAAESYEFNNALIIDRSLSDFVFTQQG